MDRQRIIWSVMVLAAAAGAASGKGLVRVNVAAGTNISCPWSVAVEGEDGHTELNICAQHLSLSFHGRQLAGDLLEMEQTSQAPKTDDPVSWPETTPSAIPLGFQTHKDASPSSAPGGYVQLHDGVFYKVHEERLSWRRAKAACEAEGAHLVVVDSKAEAAALKALLNPLDEVPDQFHAGFYMEYYTEDGRPLSSLGYQRWAPEEPSDPVCGRVDGDAWLLLGVCSQRRRFVCERGGGRSNATARPPVDSDPPHGAGYHERLRGNAPPGYMAAPGFNGSYYMTEEHNFRTSTHINCIQDRAKLAIIESEEEAEALMDFWQIHYMDKSIESADLHLGILTTKPVTVLGSPLSSIGYQRWATSPSIISRVCANVKMMLRSCSQNHYSRHTFYLLCEYKL